MEEREFTLSESEVEALSNNRVWKLIVEDVMGKALLESEENDHLDPMTETVKLARNQGSIENAKWVVDLPKRYSEQARINKEEKKDDNRK